MVKFCPLFSGSNGNCIFVSYKDTRLLIDCGFSYKKIKESLSKIDEDILDIDALLLTHSHNDHTSALPMILKTLTIPILGSKGTLTGVYSHIATYLSRAYQSQSDSQFALKNIGVKPFNVPHDAEGTQGYNLYFDNKSISILTDVGYLEDSLFDNVDGKELIFLEANHDLFSLENCSYPQYLKQRILSKFGHLSNDNAGKFATHLINKSAKNIYLGHLSGEANTEQLAYDTVASVLHDNEIKIGQDVSLLVAKRGELGKVVNL